jgi:hypothetical protein
MPAGLAWLPALALLAAALAGILRLETRLATSMSGISETDRSRVLATVVLAAFVAFTGVAAMIPGGLAEVGAAALLVPGPGESSELGDVGLAALIIGDAIVAFALGYRAAALRYAGFRDRLWSAATYAVVVAIAAGAARAIDLPRLIGPAMLTLILYLWDTVHGAAPARRRDAQFIWETALLVVLGVVVVAWNLQLRA